MLNKFFNKKKDNKGFTLVELVIVVAILAILVGLLAPQYTKYVEKSRKAADVSNLDNIVQGFKVAAADSDYTVQQGTYQIIMKTSGTTITATPDANTPEGVAGAQWTDAIKEYTGYSFTSGTELTAVKLKSAKWTGTDWSDGTATSSNVNGNISAVVTVKEDGSVTVKYSPASVFDAKGTAAPAKS